MSERFEQFKPIKFQETKEFKTKKRQFFARLGLEMREVLKQHKIHRLWERDEKGESWRNVSEHCLVETARAEVFAEMLRLSDNLKKDLKLAAALHDFLKREEIEVIKGALKSEEPIWDILEKHDKEELKTMRQTGIEENIIYIARAPGGEKEVLSLMLEILDKQGPFSDNDVACLLLHYIDDYTRGSEWADSAETVPIRGRINEFDRRIDKNESNPNYKRLNEEGTGWFKEGETAFQAQRRIGHLVEGKIAELLKERSGIDIDPLDLPEFIDNEIRGKIKSA